MVGRVCLACKGWEAQTFAKGTPSSTYSLLLRHAKVCVCTKPVFSCPRCGEMCICTHYERQLVLRSLGWFLEKNRSYLGGGSGVLPVVEEACARRPSVLDHLMKQGDCLRYALKCISERSKYVCYENAYKEEEEEEEVGLRAVLAFKRITGVLYYANTSPKLREAQLLLLGRSMHKLMASPHFLLNSARFLCCSGPYLLIVHGARRHKNQVPAPGCLFVEQEPVRMEQRELFFGAAQGSKPPSPRLPRVLERIVETYIGTTIERALAQAWQDRMCESVARIQGLSKVRLVTDSFPPASSYLINEAFENVLA